MFGKYLKKCLTAVTLQQGCQVRGFYPRKSQIRGFENHPGNRGIFGEFSEKVARNRENFVNER